MERIFYLNNYLPDTGNYTEILHNTSSYPIGSIKTDYLQALDIFSSRSQGGQAMHFFRDNHGISIDMISDIANTLEDIGLHPQLTLIVIDFLNLRKGDTIPLTEDNVALILDAYLGVIPSPYDRFNEFLVNNSAYQTGSLATRLNNYFNQLLRTEEEKQRLTMLDSSEDIQEERDVEFTLKDNKSSYLKANAVGDAGAQISSEPAKVDSFLQSSNLVTEEELEFLNKPMEGDNPVVQDPNYPIKDVNERKEDDLENSKEVGQPIPDAPVNSFEDLLLENPQEFIEPEEKEVVPPYLTQDKEVTGGEVVENSTENELLRQLEEDFGNETIMGQEPPAIAISEVDQNKTYDAPTNESLLSQLDELDNTPEDEVEPNEQPTTEDLLAQLEAEEALVKETEGVPAQQPVAEQPVAEQPEGDGLDFRFEAQETNDDAEQSKFPLTEQEKVFEPQEAGNGLPLESEPTVPEPTAPVEESKVTVQPNATVESSPDSNSNGFHQSLKEEMDFLKTSVKRTTDISNVAVQTNFSTDTPQNVVLTGYQSADEAVKETIAKLDLIIKHKEETNIALSSRNTELSEMLDAQSSKIKELEDKVFSLENLTPTVPQVINATELEELNNKLDANERSVLTLKQNQNRLLNELDIANTAIRTRDAQIKELQDRLTALLITGQGLNPIPKPVLDQSGPTPAFDREAVSNRRELEQSRAINSDEVVSNFASNIPQIQPSPTIQINSETLSNPKDDTVRDSNDIIDFIAQGSSYLNSHPKFNDETVKELEVNLVEIGADIERLRGNTK